MRRKLQIVYQQYFLLVVTKSARYIRTVAKLPLLIRKRQLQAAFLRTTNANRLRLSEKGGDDFDTYERGICL